MGRALIKAIIFDCFGVVRIEGTLVAYQAMGGDIEKDQDFIWSTINAANSGQIPASRPIIAERLGISVEEWGKAIESASEINQPVLDYCLELREKYKTGMLSNVGKGGMSQWFEAGFLDKYFDVVAGSGDIGFAKPEARAYEITADKLGVRLDECVFIDDRQEYVDGATAVGMRALLFTSASKLKRDLSGILES